MRESRRAGWRWTAPAADGAEADGAGWVASSGWCARARARASGDGAARRGELTRDTVLVLVLVTMIHDLWGAPVPRLAASAPVQLQGLSYRRRGVPCIDWVVSL